MNVNDELHDALKTQQELLNCHNYRAYLLVTQRTAGKAKAYAAGEFSDLFKCLFDASCSDENLRALVKSTALALDAWERQQEELKRKGGAV